MKIPQQPSRQNGQASTAATAKGPALSLDSFKLETLRQQIEQNPLAALNALDAWRTAEENTSGQSVRWPLEQMPLKVWIPPASNSGASPKYLFATLRQWEIGSEGLIRFRLMDTATESAESAHIVFDWHRETVKGRDYEVGHANRDVRGQRIQRVAITLIEEPLIDGQLNAIQRQSRLLATVLHEVGHALGLEHSENPQDVMYYRGWQRDTLSVNDIRRLKALYQNSHRSA